MLTICQTALIMQCLCCKLELIMKRQVIIWSSPTDAVFTLSQINKQSKEHCCCSASFSSLMCWYCHSFEVQSLCVKIWQLFEPRTTYNVISIPGHTIEGESHSAFRHRKLNWKNILPLTGRSVLISVRRHAANTHTHIKLTWKTETVRQRERSQCWVSHRLHSICSSFHSQKQQSTEKDDFKIKKQAHAQFFLSLNVSHLFHSK